MRRPNTLAIRVLVLLALTVRLLPAPLSLVLAQLDPLAGFTICHADDSVPAPAKPDKPAHDCTLCPVCLWQPFTTLPNTTTEPPRPRFVTAGVIAWPPTTGPPPTPIIVVHPRGPPA